MLQEGHKGVVLQRDGKTYAIAPHLPCGLVTPDMLRRIADVAEKYGAKLKCTGAQRIAIVGLKEEDVDGAWADLGQTNPGHMTGLCVRSVKACPGTHFCKRARQNSLSMGLELDKRYHGRKLPGKMKMGVSGCGNQCSETCIKDIGLVGGGKGWVILVGGMGGTYAKLAKELSYAEFTNDQALEIVEKLVVFFERMAQPGERLGEVIARLGMSAVRQAVGVN
jgi:NAD(P)H-nitrite reductase large subunit